MSSWQDTLTYPRLAESKPAEFQSEGHPTKAEILQHPLCVSVLAGPPEDGSLFDIMRELSNPSFEASIETTQSVYNAHFLRTPEGPPLCEALV